MQSNLPRQTFIKLLKERGLYPRYMAFLYGSALTAQEKDAIYCIGLQARKLTETK